MYSLEHRIDRCLESVGIRPNGDTLIIATLSGGADSVALLSALVAMGYRCQAAHCNFHLRGDESDRDQKHAEHIAESLGVMLHVKHFDVQSHIDSQPGTQSIEMACRELRYNWFEELRNGIGADYIAVAHNADDNIETVFLNMIRGCGIAGVKGMRILSERNILRPMLECSRHDVEEYLAARNIPYITDSSNLECDYKRNKLRNIVLPVLYANFPEAKQNIPATIHSLSNNESLYRQLIKEKLQHYITTDGNFNIISLRQNEEFAETLLFEYLKQYGANMATVKSILSCADSSGQEFNIGNSTFVTSRGILRKVEHIDTNQWNISDIFEISKHHISEFNPTHDRSTAYFDAKVLDRNIHTRTWEAGDRIYPYGMSGSRKVSDIFSDAKIPVDIKHRLPLLFADSTLLWIPGLRAARDFKVTDTTEQFISVRYIGPIKI